MPHACETEDAQTFQPNLKRKFVDVNDISEMCDEVPWQNKSEDSSLLGLSCSLVDMFIGSGE
jgi:hypothetical protein